ncbi:PrsW family glutamic-type intramembrane protease [Effusibacillus lacus]|uniref:Protease PrsW n=1 Tax=Effusibacillus lacus TaxID=1348429 RepID=A0A292YKK3_9BACL|nr:PrsW family glutamic-type intramembrane protease [Effusibacillus lacus]TCS75257.1 RsiW-degrading membrane proteinase PrsW (M82 family) [Effusibacillus lacus]GAX89696.1 protease PrsW [Effusibacillus lacus]
MSFLLLGVAAVAPGIVLLSYFYLKDLYEIEPLRSVLGSFLLGMISVFPVSFLQQQMEQYVGSPFLHVLFVAAGAEEIIKFVVLLLFLAKSKEANEIYDGILYAVAISLGFATVENLVFVISQGWQTAAIRALLPIPGHALFAVVMGFYAGKGMFSGSSIRYRLLGQSLLYAWGLHAVYDLILLGSHFILASFIIPFMIGLWILGLRKVKRAQEKSPFKQKIDIDGMK